jgi:ribose 5-phosphate isomerase B
VRVYLGSDHAGLELKTALVGWLGEAGHEAVDCGPAEYDPEDDYPVYVLRAAEGVIGDPGSLGIVIGGSGNGEQIAANKVPGIRAALAWTTETARLARQHNDANVLSLGARMYPLADALGFAKVFVVQASAARTPGILFEAICSPLPEPPITMPRLPGSPTTPWAARIT